MSPISENGTIGQHKGSKEWTYKKLEAFKVPCYKSKKTTACIVFSKTSKRGMRHSEIHYNWMHATIQGQPHKLTDDALL